MKEYNTFNERRCELITLLAKSDNYRAPARVYERIIDRLHGYHKNWYVVREKVAMGLGGCL